MLKALIVTFYQIGIPTMLSMNMSFFKESSPEAIFSQREILTGFWSESDTPKISPPAIKISVPAENSRSTAALKGDSSVVHQSKVHPQNYWFANGLVPNYAFQEAHWATSIKVLWIKKNI